MRMATSTPCPRKPAGTMSGLRSVGITLAQWMCLSPRVPWQQARCANSNTLAQHVGLRSVRNGPLAVDEGVGHSFVHLPQHVARVPLNSSYDEAARFVRGMVFLMHELESPVFVSGDGEGDLGDGLV